MTTAIENPSIPQAEIQRLLAMRPGPAAEKSQPRSTDAPPTRPARRGFLSAVREIVEDVLDEVIDGS